MTHGRSRSVANGWLIAALLALALLPATGAAATQDVVFTIDPLTSTLQYSATGGQYSSYAPSSPGSDITHVDGHFLVRFDPLTDTPASIQFVGGNGYYEQISPLSLVSTPPGVTVSYNNLSFDFNSAPLTGSGGVFSATTTSFTLLSGVLTETFLNGSHSSFDEAGYSANVTAGHWELAEVGGAGSGNWRLSINGSYTDPLGSGPRGSSETFQLKATASAHFGASNITNVAPTDTHAEVLGGASTPGGVSINLDGASNGGTFTAQQIPNSGGLSQQAIAAAAANPTFGLSTSNLSVDPQIWTVDYTGLQPGQLATLVFHYDPSTLPAGTDESTLGMWHFNKTSNAWEFGGTVNTADHTITFVTDNFSPFELGQAVPEPATIVLVGMGVLAWAGCQWRRRGG